MDQIPEDEWTIGEYEKMSMRMSEHALYNFHGDLLQMALEAAKQIRNYVWAHRTTFLEKKQKGENECSMITQRER